ncbi:MAG TPA: MFS transporter [Candidatus Limnocylindrales bacterium]|nr:MFS transporter [Candidatus Limnocylindrales bacterium]
MATSAQTAQGASQTYKYNLPFVIGASAAGTTIEWYDFYLYGVLAVFFAQHFFPPGNEVTALLSALATFGAGFAVRPFGAVFFGRIGDLVGRKFTFLLTISIMGGATALVGILPTYAQVGILAPILLVLIRLLQGLALGGEYGGAAIYVAEHSPDDKRGQMTSWIQTTATLGLLLALAVIGVTRASLGEEAFTDWGWRIPFLLSAILVAIALYIRLRLRETPLFTRLKDSGQSSTQPLRDSLGSGKNWKLILLALIGMTAGQAVVWYTGQFYALFFLQTQMGVAFIDSYIIVGVAIVLATPFFIFFGWLSDRIGRKPIILGGCLVAALSYVPIYLAMNAFAHPSFDADGKVIAAGASPDLIPLILLVFIQVVFVTAVYGPIAAFLVEFFPAKIRYTSLSVPYHLGNGWFGGFVPLIATAIVTATLPGGLLAGFNSENNPNGNIYLGLAYPITVALITAVVGTLFIRETFRRRIWDEVGGHHDDVAARKAAPPDSALAG